jgi:hypothetical protein
VGALGERCMKISEIAVPVRRIFVRNLVAILAALYLGWPLIVENQTRICGLASSILMAVLLASQIRLGESNGVGRWVCGAIATILSIGAPLGFAYCMNDQPGTWWVGVSGMSLGLTAIIAWKSRS